MKYIYLPNTFQPVSKSSTDLSTFTNVKVMCIIDRWNHGSKFLMCQDTDFPFCI